MTSTPLSPLHTEPAESGGSSHASTTVIRRGRPAAPAQRRLLDIDVLAEWLATSPRHIRRLVAERRVPFVKVGHFIRFDPDDIGRWIEEQKVTIDGD